jgi:hypothetical protein
MGRPELVHCVDRPDAKNKGKLLGGWSFSVVDLRSAETRSKMKSTIITI